MAALATIVTKKVVFYFDPVIFCFQAPERLAICSTALEPDAPDRR